MQRLADYFRFLGANGRLLAFGFLMTAFSGFGQTFFVGVFGAELRAAFALSHGEFGFIYSLATLINAVCFVWAGRQIDHLDLRLYAASTIGLYVAACLLLALMPPLAWLLVVAFALLRLSGQGLMSHIGGATMARYFRHRRGTAVSVSSLGFPAAEATLPPAGVALMAAVGWRATWLVIAALLIAVLLPLALWLLRDHGERERRFQEERAAARATEGERDWLLSEVLRDPHFYLVLPTIAFTPFLVTGVFFHQAHVSELKGWSLGLFASAFAAYAAASLVGTLGSGPLVDRVGARRLVAFLLMPIGGALLALAATDHPAAAFAFMIGAGLTAGAGLTLLSALWAEMYGAEHIGAIRSVVWTVIVCATALAPVLFGVLFDAGVTVAAIALAALGGAGVCAGLAGPGRSIVASHRTPPREED
jgi:MFS family permease